MVPEIVTLNTPKNVPSATITETNQGSSTTLSMTNTPNPGPFASRTSPAFVLIYFAVGLSTISMAIVFGWRCSRFGRGVIPHRLGGGVEVWDQSQHGDGEKPQFWNLWVEKIALGERDISWGSIMPITVMGTPDASVTRDSHPAPTYTPSTHHYPWPLRSVSTGTDVRTEPVTPSYTRLQVAVLIAMPSPPSSNSHTSHDHEAVDKSRMNYMIGLYHYARHGRGEG